MFEFPNCLSRWVDSFCLRWDCVDREIIDFWILVFRLCNFSISGMHQAIPYIILGTHALMPAITTGLGEEFLAIFRNKITTILKLAIHLSFLTFRYVRALFGELLREIGNQSLYTSYNITDFVHLWFCEELDEKLSLSPFWRFVKIPTVWRERRNARWEKWLARWFTKCHLYTHHVSHFANSFLRSRKVDNKCIAG